MVFSTSRKIIVMLNSYISAAFFIILLISCQPSTPDVKSKAPTKSVEYAMVIHGGAGTILKKNMSAAQDSAYRQTLTQALNIGGNILKTGGSSTEAVIETIAFMEDSPLFNAGKGAVFTHDGQNELDASIMHGKDLNAGAIGGVGNIKNPIKGALAVMEKSDHVFLTGEGAEEFCKSVDLEVVDPKYFYTDRRWEALQKILNKEGAIGSNDPVFTDSKFGTVGAVALDKEGNIVAGTSTGGMTNKKFNRIGDSPVIGAGTYANNNTCGVSCTGHGEFFIRYAVAHDVSAMMEYSQNTLGQAAEEIVNSKLKEAGGSGGLVALDKYGNVSMPFNTEGMYRGYINDKTSYVGIYKDE